MILYERLTKFIVLDKSGNLSIIDINPKQYQEFKKISMKKCT